jgi:hypothetical protein
MLAVYSLVPCLFVADASAQPGSPACEAAKKAVAAAQQRLADLEAQKNDPRYAGPAATLYKGSQEQRRGSLR